MIQTHQLIFETAKEFSMYEYASIAIDEGAEKMTLGFN